MEHMIENCAELMSYTRFAQAATASNAWFTDLLRDLEAHSPEIEAL